MEEQKIEGEILRISQESFSNVLDDRKLRLNYILKVHDDHIENIKD